MSQKWPFVKPSSEKSAYRRPGIESLGNQSPNGLSEGGHSSTFPRKENLDFTGEEQPTGLCRRLSSAWNGGSSAHVRCSSKRSWTLCKTRALPQRGFRIVPREPHGRTNNVTTCKAFSGEIARIGLVSCR